MLRTVYPTRQLLNYVTGASRREDDIAQRLRAATEQLPEAEMTTSPEEAQLLGLLVAITNATTVLEIGVFTGYSTLAMARELPPQGRLIACDVNAEWAEIGRPFWEHAGVADQIEFKLGPALETLDLMLTQGAAGSIDLAFVDADKENYLQYFQRCLDLLRPGGLLILDNVLWSGRVADPQTHDPETNSLRALNAALQQDSRVMLSMLPVFDGLTLAVKRPDG